MDYAGDAYAVDNWREHEHLDLALLRVDGAAGTIYKVQPAATRTHVTAYAADGRTRRLRVEQTVLVDSETPSSTLIVNGHDASEPPPPAQDVLELAGEIQPGFSGGPIIDHDGRLVALSYAHTDGHTLAITAHEIQLLLVV